MKKVYIKYNPYKLETEIQIEGKKLAGNSMLGDRINDGSRMQEWIEDLPRFLIDEYNDNQFHIEFHGTVMDYEDLVDVFTQANERGELTVQFDRIPAKETTDKEVLIDCIFEKIQQGPFEELRATEVSTAFKHAKSSDFEVCVVATMSAGKSTLINSMLRTKLMPSKQEACTAIITRIKDCSQEAIPFMAEVHDRDRRLIETHQEMKYTTMERLNSDPNVSEIDVFGNIPFVASDDVSLVLVDTPGPNNSRDPMHRKVQSEFLGKSSKSLVLYIMTGEFGTDDDNALLKRVADSMSVGGKQSKDRFIFVVNKLDGRKKEDGDITHTLNRIRSYLKTHGIENPKLFPAAALPALNIRLIATGEEQDEDTIDETEVTIKKLNRNEEMHFEKFVELPPSIRGQINDQLAAARNSWTEKPVENPDEALIHTGVVAIESAIRQYVQKYAKTSKIKNIVDTFIHKLDEVGSFEATKREIAVNKDEHERIIQVINSIEQKIASGKEAKKFSDKILGASESIRSSSQQVINEIIGKYQALLTNKIDSIRDEEFSVDDAEYEVELLKKFAKKLEPEFEADLDELVRQNLINVCVALLEEYRSKLAQLNEDLNVGHISIDPIKLMSGSLHKSEFEITQFIKEKEVEDGEEWVENTSKRWYKPWTWRQESGYYRTTYKTIRYITGSDLARDFLSPIEEGLYKNGKAAQKYAIQQSKVIEANFMAEFKRLDGILNAKLEDLKYAAMDEKRIQERIQESEAKLAWLEQIKREVESILEI